MSVSLMILPAAQLYFFEKTKSWDVEQTRPIFVIQYNNDDCGCAVNGVVQIQIADANQLIQNEKDWIWLTVSDSNIAAVFPRKACWFFDEPLRLDYFPSKQQFRLESDQQVYC